MSVSQGQGITVQAGVPFYRITSRAHRARKSAYVKVVNGQGARKSAHGARYNYAGALTVYLANSAACCLAEKMFYFHREVITAVDIVHFSTMPLPHFSQTFVLWEIELRNPVANVYDLNVRSAASAGVFPAMMLNPSQDYRHLKERRAAIENAGYAGLQARSTRTTTPDYMTVLFDDQSSNVARIDPFEVEFRLITPSGAPFTLHASDELDYYAGEVRILPPAGGTMPATLAPFSAWTRLDFNH